MIYVRVDKNQLPQYYPFQTTGLYRYYPKSMARPGRAGPEMMQKDGRAAGPSAAGGGPPIEMRTDFPETWIWDSFDMGSE